MKIITRENVQIRKGNGNPFITFNRECIYFTQSSASICNIVHNKRVNFIERENSWTFYFHDDIEGFLVQKYGSGFRVHSKPLIRMIVSSLRMGRETFSFYIKDTGEEMDRHPIFKILTNKPVE